MGGLFSKSESNEQCKWVADYGRGDYTTYNFMSSSNPSKYCSRNPTDDELARKPADKYTGGKRKRNNKKTQKRKIKK